MNNVSSTQTIAAKGHSWITATLAKNNGVRISPTHSNDGVYYQTCANCNAKDTSKYNVIAGTAQGHADSCYPPVYRICQYYYSYSRVPGKVGQVGTARYLQAYAGTTNSTAGYPYTVHWISADGKADCYNEYQLEYIGKDYSRTICGQ